MFVFPYLSPTRSLAHTPQWSSFRTLLLARPAFPPLMASCPFLHLSGSPGWHPTYIGPFLLTFRYCQDSRTGWRGGLLCLLTSLPTNPCLALAFPPSGSLTPTQLIRQTEGSTLSLQNLFFPTWASHSSWWQT